jgi:N-acetyl-gamma-glutamyl-phosphate reductase
MTILDNTTYSIRTVDVSAISSPADSPAAVPQTAILGVSGYAGAELARLLLQHPRLQAKPPVFYGRAAEAGTEDTAKKPKATLTGMHPHLSISDPAVDVIEPFDWEHLAKAGVTLLFLATPHEQSREMVPEALARGIRIVDLSGAWRLQNSNYRDVYQLTDHDPAAAATMQQAAVYGAPELHGDAIRTAQLVANPGCYATSIILALAPLVQSGLVDLEHGIICDSKSGVSGAGKAATAKTHFMYAADNLSAYNVFGHRHMGELFEQLNLLPEQIQFTPHLLPIPRGILSTIYLRFKQPVQSEQVSEMLRTFYKQSPMVRLRATPHLPQIQHVVRTNYFDLGFVLDKDGKRLVLVACLDNLLKGAAGQAVQNMNVMYQWNETEGLL